MSDLSTKKACVFCGAPILIARFAGGRTIELDVAERTLLEVRNSRMSGVRVLRQSRGHTVHRDTCQSPYRGHTGGRL